MDEGELEMIEKLTSPILITGCARSGTSMIAGIINLCGAFGGNMSGPNRNNQKGMFENAKVRETIMKPYLRKINVDPLGQYPLPDVGNLLIPADLRERVEQVMVNEGYVDGKWMYKGAKMCLMWPAWYYAFPDAKWIIVRRRTGDIISSCIKTGFMRAFDKAEMQKAVGVDNVEAGWLWWVHQHKKRFVEMINEGLNYKIVWPERMVDGDYTQVMEMMEWLGLPWKSEVLSFMDPLLWKSRQLKSRVK